MLIRSFTRQALARLVSFKLGTASAVTGSCMESGFWDWLLVERDLAKSYVKCLRRQHGTMLRAGVDFSSFLHNGKAARLAVRPYLADLKERDKVHAVKLAQKLLNHYAAFLRLTDEGGQPTKWRLAKVPRRRLDPYTAAEVQAIVASLRPGFKGARQAAMLFLLAHTGLRKGEVYRLRAEDFDSDRGAVLLRRPEKDGTPRWVNLPDSAWEPTSRLYQWLVLRSQVDTAGDGALWVRQSGEALTEPGFTSDLFELRIRSGVPLNFNRWRHSRGTVGALLQLEVTVQQEEWGHGDPRSTTHYMHRSQGSRRQALAEAGMPGYERRERDRELVDALALV